MSVLFFTDRLIVRRFDSNDYDDYFLLSGDEDVMRYIRPVISKEDSDLFVDNIIADSLKNGFVGRWAVTDRERVFMGSFAILPLPFIAGELQIGYSFLPAFWGNGYATEITEAGTRFFFDNFPLKRLYGVTEKPNTASQKVLLKAGFKESHQVTEDEKELLIFVRNRN